MQRRSSSSVQGLIFGGLMAALVVVLALVPGLSILMPIPLVLVFMRHGGRVAVMTAVVSVLMTMAFRGAVDGILVIPSGILPGLIFGLGFRRQWKPLTIGLSAVAVFFVGFALSYVVMRLALYGGRDPIEMMFQGDQMRQFWRLAVDSMEQGARLRLPATLTPEQTTGWEAYLQSLEEMRSNPAGIYWTLLPTAVFLSGSLITWINWSLFKWTLPRFGYNIPEPIPFGQFKLPVWLVWVFGLLLLVSRFVPPGSSLVGASWGVKLLLNLISPLSFIFALAGAAVVYGYLLRRWNPKPGMAVLIIALFVVTMGFQMAVQLLMIVAMWDTIFDFRGLGHGLWKRPEENT